MTAVRQRLPGSTYLCTRRTANGACRLKPTRQVYAILLFALAIAAMRYDVTLHAFIAMPNHVHLVVTDHSGDISRFLGLFHQLVALGLGRLQKEPGPLWDASDPDIKRIQGPVTELNKVVYTLANAAAADLCDSPGDWYGAMSPVALIGAGPITVRRPEAFSTEHTSLEEEATLSFEAPPGHAHRTATEYRVLLEGLLRERGEAIREQRRRAGRQVLSRGAVRGRSLFARPRVHPSRRRSERGPRPPLSRHIECDPELHEEAVQALLGFRRAYEQAFERWRDGERDVEFPRGTYKMVRIHGAREAPG